MHHKERCNNEEKTKRRMMEPRWSWTCAASNLRQNTGPSTGKPTSYPYPSGSSTHPACTRTAQPTTNPDGYPDMAYPCYTLVSCSYTAECPRLPSTFATLLFVGFCTNKGRSGHTSWPDKPAKHSASPAMPPKRTIAAQDRAGFNHGYARAAPSDRIRDPALDPQVGERSIQIDSGTLSSPARYLASMTLIRTTCTVLSMR